MEGSWLWLTALSVLSLLLSSRAMHHRRSMAAPTILPVSKGGWRPVVGSGNLPGFGHFQAAPLHAPAAYKIPVPVMDSYPSSSKPLAARDGAKSTSPPQQYRQTTLRNLPAAPPHNQPINTYLNPFGLQTGLSHYKIVQNFPMESMVIRNPHNPYTARPMPPFSKYPPKYKQFHNQMLQYNYGPPPHQGNQGKPHDVFGKPVEVYVRPQDSKKGQNFKNPNAPEIYKQEVYKLPDSDTAPQSVNQQQVKTAQQQQHLAGTKPTSNPFQQYPYKEEKFAPLPPSILGTFNTFGVQSVKGREPIFPGVKTTYVPVTPTKQTIFNSFSYMPFKTSPNPFLTTTPKLQNHYNHLVFGTTNDFKAPPTQQVKLSTPYKTEMGQSNKGMFKASPQDPFAKHTLQGFNKFQSSHLNKLPQVTTYSPSVASTATNSYHHNDVLQQHGHNAPFTSYYHQNYDKKQNVHDNFASSGNKPPSSQYPSPPTKQKIEATPDSVPFRATYDVTELYGDDVITHSSPHSWSPAPDGYSFNTQQKPALEDSATIPIYGSDNYDKPTTVGSNFPEEYEIVTDGFDSHLETQSKRPSEDKFEPIVKHKLKDYYYKVSTPAQEEYSGHYKKTKVRPTEESIKVTEANDYSTSYNVNDVKPNNNEITESLPTLPPNQHFKRPSAIEPLDKDKIRKRNKNRRRRPLQPNKLVQKEETSTRRYVHSTTESYTTEGDEVHTYRPRPRIPAFAKPKLTTPSISTDLSTSALPTISPTTPTTIVKKKSHRPTTTQSDRYETTTTSYKENDLNKESQIMKITTRDYSHKQDEKDTPTSDVSVSISETTSRNKPESMKFYFHKDVKPIEPSTEHEHKETENIESKRTASGSKNEPTDETSQHVTTTAKPENETSNIRPIKRPRIKSKYENNRPRFSVKDYRNRMSSTTTTERSTEQHIPKLKFPQRRLPFHESKVNIDNDNTTEGPRKKFVPKDPRYKTQNADENVDPTTEKEVVHPTRTHIRPRTTTTTEAPETTHKISSRIRTRRPKPEEATESNHVPAHSKRPMRKKVKDTEIGESVQDISVTETTPHDQKDETSTERKRSESAIMKIAKDEKKHQSDHIDAVFEQSKRVSDLTLAASKDYNTPGMFKAVSPNSRRIPSYFTIATDDPILPIEAFFPQLNQKKET